MKTKKFNKNIVVCNSQHRKYCEHPYLFSIQILFLKNFHHFISDVINLESMREFGIYIARGEDNKIPLALTYAIRFDVFRQDIRKASTGKLFFFFRFFIIDFI